MSPSTSSIERGGNCFSALLRDLTRARTVTPLATSARTRLLPSNPVAPVTKAIRGSLASVFFVIYYEYILVKSRKREYLLVKSKDPIQPTSKARPRRLQQRGQRRVNQLLDAADAVFAEIGYERATTNAISKYAGVSPGTFYQFFPNKQVVEESLATRCWE